VVVVVLLLLLVVGVLRVPVSCGRRADVQPTPDPTRRADVDALRA